MSTYNTNLAAEFYVLSMLHRVGADPTLTIGNKKAVDIILSDKDGMTATVDVKGLAGPYDWPADNIRLPSPPRHFLALVSFEGKIDDPNHVPRVWILPASELGPFMRKYRTRTVVSRAQIMKNGERYLNSWSQLASETAR